MEMKKITILVDHNVGDCDGGLAAANINEFIAMSCS